MSILLLKKTVQMFLVLIMGYLLVKTGKAKAKDSILLSKISLYLLMPCTILKAFQVDFTTDVRKGLIIVFLAAVCIQLFLLACSSFFGRIFHFNAIEKASVPYSNTGNLLIPIVEMVLGNEYTIYASAFVVTQLFFLWSHGVSLFQKSEKSNWKNIFLNINMLSIYIGVFLLISQFKLPETVNGACASMSAMLGPAAMIITGMLAAEINLKEMFMSKRIYLLSFLRLILCPILIMIILIFIQQKGKIFFDEKLLIITLLSTMTPTASIVTQFAQVYEGDAKYAGAVNMAATVFCIVTMPFLFWIYGVIGNI